LDHVVENFGRRHYCSHASILAPRQNGGKREKTAAGKLTAEDTAAFDAVFHEWGADNYEQAHALVGREASESSSGASGWKQNYFDGDYAGWMGETTETTVEASSKTSGEATIGAPPQSGEGDGPSDSGARSTTTTNVHKWNSAVYVGLPEEQELTDVDWESYDDRRTYRVTDVLSGAGGSASHRSSQSLDWQTVHEWERTLGAYAGATAGTQQYLDVEQGRHTQELKTSGSHQSATIDRSLAKVVSDTSVWETNEFLVGEQPEGQTGVRVEATVRNTHTFANVQSTNETSRYSSSHDVTADGRLQYTEVGKSYALGSDVISQGYSGAVAFHLLYDGHGSDCRLRAGSDRPEVSPTGDKRNFASKPRFRSGK
jgi:hypothetical protein